MNTVFAILLIYAGAAMICGIVIRLWFYWEYKRRKRNPFFRSYDEIE